MPTWTAHRHRVLRAIADRSYLAGIWFTDATTCVHLSSSVVRTIWEFGEGFVAMPDDELMNVTDAGRALLRQWDQEHPSIGELTPQALAAVPEITAWLERTAKSLRHKSVRDGLAVACHLLNEQRKG